jgi:hypothetical protein
VASSVVAETEEVGSTVRCSASAADAMNREARASRRELRHELRCRMASALTWLAGTEFQLFVR